MQHFELKGQIRQVGNKAVVKAYRKQGVVPCNLYGLGMENILFTVDEKELKGLTHTPKSFIVDLVLDNGKTYNAVVHELQFHPVNERCLHVDFLAVNEEKPIAIILDSVKGKGVTAVEQTMANHSMKGGQEMFDGWLAELREKQAAMKA